MITVSLRDLRWRRRRFVMVVLVASLAFGLALVMSGVVNQLRLEGHQTVGLFGADRWVVADGVSGPFTTSQLMQRTLVDEVAAAPGVQAASPILIGRTAIDQRDVNIVGYDPSSTILPRKLTTALASTNHHGAIVDITLHRSVGDRFSLGGQPIEVVAVVDDTSFFFSAPTVFLPIEVVQQRLFAGQDLASAIVVRSDASTDVSGGDALRRAVATPVTVLDNNDVRADFDRVIHSTTDTIGIINVLLWLMAAGTVGAIVYVGVLERTTDFATLKSVGASDRSLLVGLVAQTAIVSVVSGVAAVGICRLISPTFSFPVRVPGEAYAQLLAVSLAVGVVASLAGIRKITSIDPTIAFGGAS